MATATDLSVVVPVEILPGLPATIEQARALTEEIRHRLADVKQLVLAAYEAQVHLALGYASWEAYVEAELGVHRSYTYRLMNTARAERALEQILSSGHDDRVAFGDRVTMPEYVTRGVDVDQVLDEVRDRIGPTSSDAASAIAVFRQVADEMRRRPPEPDESVANNDTRHVLNLDITQITDPVSGGPAWLWESQTGWNRGWVRIVRLSDPKDMLEAWGEIQGRYRQHLRGEILEGAELSVARARSATHDPVDWQGPITRGGVIGWLAPSGHFYPEDANVCRKMLAKRIALGLPTQPPDVSL